MMDFPEDLQREITYRGGLDLPRHADAWTRHLIAQVIKAMEQYRSRVEQMYFVQAGIELKCAVYNSHEAAAFSYLSPASHPKKIAFIGVSYGFIFNSVCLASLMAARRDMLSEVGSPDLEKGSVSLTYMPSTMSDSELHALEPICNVRKAFSAFLAVRFVESIFMHEASHITRGHLGLKQSAGLRPSISGGRPISNLEPLTLQAIEFDADEGAVEEVFNYFSVVQEQLSKGAITSSDGAAIKGLESLYADSLRAAKFAFQVMYLPLRLFQHTSWERKYQAGQSHPLPPIRMLYLVYVFSAGVLSDEEFGLSTDTAKETVLSWAAECESNYMAFCGEPIDAQGLLSAWHSPESTDYIGEIQAELIRLEPLLAKYKMPFRSEP
jgi:hypothetical protein